MNSEKTMQSLIENFPKDLSDVIKILSSERINLPHEKISNIVICGMGGSSIGGRLAEEIFIDHSSVPINFVQDYFLPKYVNQNTLVIGSSYSGNTEETIELINQALTAKAKIIGVCSGGKIKELSKKHGFQIIQVPGGNPPRTAIGYSLVIQLFLIASINQDIELKDKLMDQVSKASKGLRVNSNKFKQKAKDLALQLLVSHIYIYTESRNSALGIRLKQQLNENAKLLVNSGCLPEMNHNELVAWKAIPKKSTAIFINPNNWHIQNKKRLTYFKDVINNCNANFIEISLDGSSLVEKYMNYIHLIDWISFELAILRGVDPIEIDVIEDLKKVLN